MSDSTPTSPDSPTPPDPAPLPAKALWHSKTFWINILAALAVLIPEIAKLPALAVHSQVLAVALACVNVVLRLSTSQAVTVNPSKQNL
jgi:hypothetical protein